MVLMAAGHDAVLVAVTSKGTKVGLVLFEMRKAAADVERIMNEPAPSHAVPVEETHATEEGVYSGSSEVTPVGPVRAPEPTPAEEAESSLPRW